MAQQGDVAILEEAKSLLVQGKRAMALEDYQSATDCLEQSCQLFDAFYGVAKRECADAYLEYGLALVALADIEAGNGTDKIFKKAGVTEDGDGDDDDEEGEDEEGEDEEAEGEGEEDGDHKKSEELKMDTDSNEEPKTNGTSKTNGISSEATKDSETNGVVNDNLQPQASSSSTSDEPQPGTSNGPEKEAEGDDDEDTANEEATTIEIAWEVLCLAKRLYMTDESLEGRLKLAETLQKIGEISIEWENNDNAVSILEECLNIRKAILPPEDRLIALTYYNLGLAHSFKSETLKANENFQNAIGVIEKRIASLTVDLDKAKESQDTVTIGTYQKEINELKELLPDLNMRLDDSKEDDTSSQDVLKRTREEMQQEDDEARKVCSDKSKQADDITHLVKRRAA